MSNLHEPQICLPGTIHFTRATRRDYQAVARHHYRDRPPATTCEAVAAWHVAARGKRPRLVGVAILSWPVPLCRARNRHFRTPVGYGNALRFANANVRTISRVVVHPQYRAAGVARALIRQLIDRCPTRYVETSATMGAFVGCFTAAGMTRFPTAPDEPAYFLIDTRHPSVGATPASPANGEGRASAL